MQHWRFYLKFLAISLIILLLLAPQAMLFGIVQERADWREQAYQSIAQSWSKEQTLTGPLLVLPYDFSQVVHETAKDAKGVERTVARTVTTHEQIVIMPQQLNLNSSIDSSLRYRGIYAVPVYNSTTDIQAHFDPQQLSERLKDYQNPNIQWGKPYLSVMVADQRGILTPPTLQWGQQSVSFAPGSALHGRDAEAGMHAVLPVATPHDLTQLDFAFTLPLSGMRGMHFALLADATHVTQSANWANPSFTGELLPTTRHITANGFDAEWRASAFTVNVQDALAACQAGDCSQLNAHSVGVNLVQPVDVYQQAERSVKYALLFIVLTFTVLVLFELIKKLRIHPVQYTLVGFALLVFYLLLISLSEHLSFSLAYALAATASTGLLSVYFSAILHNRRSGLVLGTGLASLYGLLYFILQAEENALLMGSLLIFLLLAALMFSTRHLDWYALMQDFKGNQADKSSAQNLQKTSVISPQDVNNTFTIGE